MKKAEIILTRVDNRLVHGQVGLTWASSMSIDTIVVIDDQRESDLFSQKLMRGVARAANLAISFYSVSKFVEVFNNTESQQKLFIVVENPIVCRRLVEQGIELKDINLGNMHFERGKVPMNRKVYVNEEELEAINYLIESGGHVFIQDVPGTLSVKVEPTTFEQLNKKR